MWVPWTTVKQHSKHGASTQCCFNVGPTSKTDSTSLGEWLVFAGKCLNDKLHCCMTIFKIYNTNVDFWQHTIRTWSKNTCLIYIAPLDMKGCICNFVKCKYTLSNPRGRYVIYNNYDSTVPTYRTAIAQNLPSPQNKIPYIHVHSEYKRL